MTFAIWAVVLGLLLITMAMTGALLKRLPVSPSMLYLAAGAALGPAGVALLHLDPINDSTGARTRERSGGADLAFRHRPQV
jgi:Kef-type K+ transport system membrane component KefB